MRTYVRGFEARAWMTIPLSRLNRELASAESTLHQAETCSASEIPNTGKGRGMYNWFSLNNVMMIESVLQHTDGASLMIAKRPTEGRDTLTELPHWKMRMFVDISLSYLAFLSR